MTNHILPNVEFLEMVNSNLGVPSHVLLPHEQAGVQYAYNQNVETFQRIVQSKIDVSGGDDWHDGAFRATDNEAKIATERNAVIAPYLGSLVVEYPDVTEERVSLGSRATLLQNGYEFPVDLVGFRNGYPDGVVDELTKEEVTAISLDSPLGKVIVGKVVGAEISYKNGHRTFSAKITKVDQEIVKKHFSDLPDAEMHIKAN